MNISELCIKRPVFATVLNLFILLLGVISYDRLTVREYPKIDEPVVTVETHYKGASPEIMETQISKTIEESLGGIEGIEVMSSISRQEVSQITVRFKLSRDPESAASDVRDRVGRVRGRLPKEIDEPIIAKVEADAQPVLYIAFYSDRHNAMEMTDYADRFVKDRLQNIDGVSSVAIFGERRISMRLWLDPERLAAYQITPLDVSDALQRQNIELPAGRIESNTRELTVLSKTDLTTPEEFNEIIIKREGDKLIKFKDVGHAVIGAADERRISRFNGQDAVALGVVKQAVANPLDVSKGVYELLPTLSKSLPHGMQMQVAYDSSVFIEKSIDSVYRTIMEAIVLVVLVIFFFLRSFRSTFIPLITIPISLLGAFIIMYFLGYSINTLTLLALVLAIGLVVDDAIVMLENCHRHIENGLDAKAAAIKGSKEIGFAIVAMTITLAAVYAPVAFMPGRTGRLFTEFALTLAGTVIVSGFIALTLSPMMCSKLLKHETKHSKWSTKIEDSINGFTQSYLNKLDFTLHHPLKVILFGFIFVVLGSGLSFLIRSELSPVEDRGTIIAIGIAPEGSTIQYTIDWMKKMEPIFASIPEVEKYFVIAGFPVVSQGLSFVRLKDWDQRKRSQQAIVKEMLPKIAGGIPGIIGFPMNPPSLGRSPISKPINFVIQTSNTYDKLHESVEKMMAVAKTYPGMNSIDSDLKLNKPQITVELSRDKAATVGVDVSNVASTLQIMLGGLQVTRFKQNGEQYDVILQVEDDARRNPTNISDIYVRGAGNEMVKLANIVNLYENVAPRELNHFNQLRSATITASLAPGASLGPALEFMAKQAEILLPADMQFDYDGESREFKESSASLAATFILALCFIYLVLAAQFESFLSPFIIMLTVPLSIVGALIAIYLTNGTFNIYSQIALITLIGLITKHGILIVEFANQQREKGLDTLSAVKESCHLRLRPILMTTGAMVLGALPLALAHGAGAESRQQMGWVIVGGMLVGTLFTLFIIPVVYLKFKGPNSIMPESEMMDGSKSDVTEVKKKARAKKAKVIVKEEQDDKKDNEQLS